PVAARPGKPAAPAAGREARGRVHDAPDLRRVPGAAAARDPHTAVAERIGSRSARGKIHRRRPLEPLFLRTVGQFEAVAVLDGLGHAGRRGEADAAGDDRFERAGLDRQAADEAPVQADAAGVPEPRVGADEVAVGGVDGEGNLDAAGVAGEGDGLDGPDLEAAVDHGRIDHERTSLGRLDDDLQGALARGVSAGRALQADESRLALAGSRLAFDVARTKERIEPRDAPRRDLRAHDPELAALNGEARGVAPEAGFDHDPLEILAR